MTFERTQVAVLATIVAFLTSCGPYFNLFWSQFDDWLYHTEYTALKVDQANAVIALWLPWIQTGIGIAIILAFVSMLYFVLDWRGS